jgi:DNA (cytosine-5)-methyltransferase 1
MEGGLRHRGVDTCSAGFGAPHIRQRLRLQRLGWPTPTAHWTARAADQAKRAMGEDRHGSNLNDFVMLAAWPTPTTRDFKGAPSKSYAERGNGSKGMRLDAVSASLVAEAPTDSMVTEQDLAQRYVAANLAWHRGKRWSRILPTYRPGPTNGFWSDADWLYCRDGKWRPVEPGTFPLAHGATSRVGRLRAYGNAVDGEATTEFCRAVVEEIGLI